MTAAAVLAHLRHQGARVCRVDDRLRIEAPPGVLTPELRATVAAKKTELVALLTETQPARLDIADCLLLIRQTFAAVESNYVDGALSRLDSDEDLAHRYRETELEIDRLALAGPTEAEFRAALAAHVAVIAECCARARAGQERAVEMPELDDDVIGAVGFAWRDGSGSWASVVKSR